ncbi:DUF4129 domain-containing protein [Nocardia puris]|uniref:Uncharacterized protein DUF4129 n=1 Tax=Nocardia puris TaxID=208602 RepID=A0A366DR64_9NOCA|nr:DUF4129 domain-containing protein [Nocardia puris]MBF6214166.1 DUF4129 domain-containing protein [Nocardia puris]MBF6365344.1 DUF4129 domain-containing protein [Nocardia puris]MBF6459746.1 DUF4129 domain-containing protein [Nocardia puris]RBO91708.1 uncharacterized protein DUF4129 [Nocardia puris]
MTGPTRDDGTPGDGQPARPNPAVPPHDPAAPPQVGAQPPHGPGAPLHYPPTPPETRPQDQPVHGEPPVPGVPRLGPADEHRSAAEQAAQHRDYDRALRERFRAVLRGMEQHGVLDVRRSRTADETVDDASAADLPLEVASELQPAARSFDEVVYGGRRATEDEYRRLEYADRFSAGAPPPAPEPVEREAVEVAPRTRRGLPELPELLRDPRFWAAVAGAAVVLLLLYGVLQACGGPIAPKPPEPQLPPTESPDTGDRDVDLPDFGPGSGSIFERLPGTVAFGGLQLLILLGLLIWWRARRRGALVREPRPVEVAANELLAGQAALYRRSRDHAYVAGKLRAATVRRLRPTLGFGAEAGRERLVAALTARGIPGEVADHALYGDVPDAAALRHVAAQLEYIEQEVG